MSNLIAALIPTDPTELRRLSANLQWVAIMLAVFAVLVQVAKHLTDIRERRITAEHGALREAERQQAETELSARAASALETAARSNEIAERERQARLQLEARLAPRTLTAAQQAQLATALRPFAGRAVDIFNVGVGREIADISSQIESVLQRAGVQARRWTIMGGASVRGVVFQTRPFMSPIDQDLVGNLLAQLINCGIDAGHHGTFEGDGVPASVTGPSWEPDHVAAVRVFIGDKP